MIRRPRATATDVANIWAHIRQTEAAMENLTQATSVSLQDVRGDILRVGSNQDTQRKHYERSLARVEEVAQSALERTSGLQDQIDSVRQQTRDMHQTLGAIHNHSNTLTDGLKEMMQEFKELRFELPNKFDNWLTVRLGGMTSTISGEDLQQSQWRPTVPITNVPPGVTGGSSSQGVAGVETEDANPKPSSQASLTQESANALYKQFVHGSSEEELVTEMGTAEQGRPMEGVEASWGSAPLSWDDGVRGATSGLEHATASQSEEGPTSTQNDTAPSATAQDASISVATAVQPAPDVADVPTSSQLPGSHSIRPINVVQSSVELPPSSPISPNIIYESAVEPPAGLLSHNFHLSPPSSQSSIPSPSPRPNQHLLRVPANAPLPLPNLMGPVTRSRSRSRSPTPLSPDRKSPAGKAKSRRK
jgi:hypothetical protein